MDNFTSVTELRVWIQRVLPCVYGGELTYLETLNKVVYKLNQLIENNKMLPDYINGLVQDLITSGELEKVVSDIVSELFINVKFPPNGLEPLNGDGVQDGTKTIQGCIDYAKTVGGFVFFPSGRYMTNSISTDGVDLIGMSKHSTYITLLGGSLTPLISSSGNVEITGLNLSGNTSAQTDPQNVIVSTGSLFISKSIVRSGKVLVNGNIVSFENVILQQFSENALNISSLCAINGVYIVQQGVTSVNSCVFNGTVIGSNFIDNTLLQCIFNGDNCSLRGVFEIDDFGVANSFETQNLYQLKKSIVEIEADTEVKGTNLNVNTVNPIEYNKLNTFNSFNIIPFLNDENEEKIVVLNNGKIGNSEFNDPVIPSYFTGVDWDNTKFMNERFTSNNNESFSWAQISLKDVYNYEDIDPTPNENFKKALSIYTENVLQGFTANETEAITQNFTGVFSVMRNDGGGIIGATAIAGRYYAPETSENIEKYGGNKGNAVEGISFNDMDYSKGGYVMGAEFDIFDRVTTGVAPVYENNDDIDFKRRSTGVIISGGGKTQPISIGLLIQGTDITNMWNGIVITGNSMRIGGQIGVKGTVGLNFASWRVNENYGHTAIRFGHANRQIWARDSLKIASNGTSFANTSLGNDNILRLLSSSETKSTALIFGNMDDIDVEDISTNYTRKGSIGYSNSSSFLTIENEVNDGAIVLQFPNGAHSFFKDKILPIVNSDLGSNERYFKDGYIDEIVSNKSSNVLYDTVATKFSLNPSDNVNVIDFMLKCLNQCVRG